jgi:hypothetical protein
MNTQQTNPGKDSTLMFRIEGVKETEAQSVAQYLDTLEAPAPFRKSSVFVGGETSHNPWIVGFDLETDSLTDFREMKAFAEGIGNDLMNTYPHGKARIDYSL